MKKSFLMTCATAALLIAALGTSHSAPLLDGLYPQMGETIYLTDSCLCGTTRIFRVLIDEVDSEAVLVEVGNTLDFQQVDCAGATTDGKRLFLVSKFGGGVGDGRLGYFDLETGTFHNPDGSDPGSGTVVYVREGSIGGPKVPHLVLGAFFNNTFFVGSQVTNQLYTLDITTGVATSLGKIKVADSDPAEYINLLGADLAFSADGRMVLSTNQSAGSALKGLYEVFLGPPVEGEYLGSWEDAPNAKFTGIAFRSNGFFQGEQPQGELAGSTCCDHIVVFDLGGDPMRIYNSTEYHMCDCCGAYDYTYGDMSNGPLGTFPCVGTIGYWKNHPWQYVAGIDTSVTLCGNINMSEAEGQTLLQAAKSNNFSMLTAQLIAAKLNTSGGAGLAIISEAEEFLCDSTLGTWDMPFFVKTQKAEANGYKDALDAFNNGSAISTHCD